jgi:hypothetical protein
LCMRHSKGCKGPAIAPLEVYWVEQCRKPV